VPAPAADVIAQSEKGGQEKEEQGETKGKTFLLLFHSLTLFFGWRIFKNHAFFFQLLHILLRVLLELRNAGGAAEIDPFALVIGVNLLGRR
jgi:hypothetical protein